MYESGDDVSTVIKKTNVKIMTWCLCLIIFEALMAGVQGKYEMNVKINTL